MPDSLPPSDLPAISPEANSTPALTRISMQITIVVAVVIVAALYFGREVLIPITIGFLLTFLLSPLVEWLQHLRLGRVPSVVLAVVLALAIILGNRQRDRYPGRATRPGYSGISGNNREENRDGPGNDTDPAQ